ncbi:MAG: hypothetical protein NZ899_07840 [Thermoguttaceae bacterium]|nr:hypothetical protein [Thermoguttaceae bacterium]
MSLSIALEQGISWGQRLRKLCALAKGCDRDRMAAYDIRVQDMCSGRLAQLYG